MSNKNRWCCASSDTLTSQAKLTPELGCNECSSSVKPPTTAAQSEAGRCQPVTSSVSPHLTPQSTTALFYLWPHYTGTPTLPGERELCVQGVEAESWGHGGGTHAPCI